MRHFWWGLGQLYYELIPVTLKVNLVWSLTVVPLLLPASLLTFVVAQPAARDGIAERLIPVELLITLPIMTVVLLMLAGPGTAAMYHSAHILIELEPITFKLFWQGFKRFFFRCWLLAVTDLAGLFVCLLGFLLYWFFGDLFQQIIAFMFVYLFVFW